MPPQKELIEITARVVGIALSRPSSFNEGKVWFLLNSDKGKLSGEADPGAVLTQCDYRMSGSWEETPHGKTFKFRSLALREPSTRNGVTQYLAKFCPHIGHIFANKLCDKFGTDQCVGKLRESPEEVAASGIGLNLERCLAASEALKKLSKWEDSRIKLMDIFAGRGFRAILPDLLLEKFGSKAPEIVRATPFILVEERLPGCGFSIVDQLYQSFGLDPAWIGRQVHALVYTLENLPDSSTWGRRAEVYTELGKICSKGLQMTECINEAVRLNKIKVRIEPPTNEMFLATKEQADQESMIAERLWEIGGRGLLGEKEETKKETKEEESEEMAIDDLLADEFGESVVVEITPVWLPGNVPLKIKNNWDMETVRPDIRDITTPIPAAMQKPQQDDGLTFELDASDEEDDESYEVASELVEELDGLLEQLQEIDAAVDFFESVSERLSGISENIERKHSATAKQIQALKNMSSACEVWLEQRENRKDRW